MTADTPLPAEIASLGKGINNLKFVGNGTWHSECPVCGGEDRYFIQTAKDGYPAHGKCRACGRNDRPDSSFKESPQQTTTRKRAAKSAEKQIADTIQGLRDEPFWLDLHDNMSVKGYEHWNRYGISDVYIELHKLGYDPKRYGGCLSIPYLFGGWTADCVETVQYRLTNPGPNESRYRFEQHTRASIFQAWPSEPIEKVVIVLEGVAKALVTHQYAGHVKYQGKEIVFVASPAKAIAPKPLRQLRHAETILLLMDPDAYVRSKGECAIERAVQKLGTRRVKIVPPMSLKVDDAFKAGMKADTFEAYIHEAKPIVRARRFFS